MRPAPVDTSHGTRYHILQAVLQDHTYVATAPELKLPEQPTPPPTSVSVPFIAVTTQSMQNQISQTVARLPLQTTAKLQSGLCSSSAGSVPYAPVMLTQSPLSHGATTVTAVPANVTIPSASVPAPLTQMSLSTLAAITASQSNSCGGGSNSTIQCSSSTLDYYHRSTAMAETPAADAQDDDANSVISTGSRNLNSTENDLGEETETAPEGEGEDDSITRCICDLTHDDGYMICCDKCS